MTALAYMVGALFTFAFAYASSPEKSKTKGIVAFMGAVGWPIMLPLMLGWVLGEKCRQ